MIIMDDGIALNARLDMPEGNPAKCPVMVLIHGVTGYHDEEHLNAVTRAMNEIGVAVLRSDMYGHGASGGTFHAHTLYKWVTNALTLTDYARGLEFAEDILLCGHSQGGLTAMLTAALKRDQIRALVALSPACMIPEGARKGEILGRHFDPEHIPDVLEFGEGLTLSGNYLRVAQSIRVEEAIDRYDGPVLVVHGDADETVPVFWGRWAAERYRNADLVLISGDTHCYDNHLDLVTEEVRKWVKGLLEQSRDGR